MTDTPAFTWISVSTTLTGERQIFLLNLNCLNVFSVRNTHLLYCYSQLDRRVRPLVLAIKKWARDCEINDASDNTLSSYALTLMAVFYLQAGVSPPVLPCLQETHPAMFPPESRPESLTFASPDCDQSANTESLAQLYLQFFQFFILHTSQYVKSHQRRFLYSLRKNLFPV